MKTKDIMASLVPFLLLCLIHYSAQALFDPDDLSKEQKDCLFECMTCVEVWGSQYDGETCANACVKTNTPSIDRECKVGIYVAKRYKIIKAKDDCKKQCALCLAKYAKGVYSNGRCERRCEATEGRVVDTDCKNHVGVYDLMMKYHYNT